MSKTAGMLVCLGTYEQLRKMLEMRLPRCPGIDHLGPQTDS